MQMPSPSPLAACWGRRPALSPARSARHENHPYPEAAAFQVRVIFYPPYAGAPELPSRLTV